MKSVFVLFVLAFSAATAPAQFAAPTVSPPATTLVMGVDVTNGIVPMAQPSRVRVPPGERVAVSLPATLPPGSSSLQWTRNGQPIPGATGNTLLLPSASAADSGLYQVTGFPTPWASTGIRLDVVPEGHLANISARVDLAPGNAAQTVGFVITGTTPKPCCSAPSGRRSPNTGSPTPAPSRESAVTMPSAMRSRSPILPS